MVGGLKIFTSEKVGWALKSNLFPVIEGCGGGGGGL